MKVLIPTYGGGHVNMMIPVIEKILKEGHQTIVLPFTMAEKKLQDLNIAYISLYEVICLVYAPNEIDEIYSIGKRLAEKNHNADSGLPIESTIWYYGVSMYELLADYGEKGKELFEQQERAAFCPVGFMDRIIRYFKPDIVTASCFVRMEKAAIIAAYRNRVHSLFIWDTIEKPIFHSEIDYMTCINEEHRLIFVDGGYDSEKVIAVGQPIFDELFIQKQSKKLMLSQLGLDPERKTVLWAADGSFWVKDAFEEVKQAIKELPQYNFIVKLHPTSNDEKDYEVDFSNAKVIKKYSIEELIQNSDIIVSQISTVLQQAMILEKKVLSLRTMSREVQGHEDQLSLYPETQIRHVCNRGELGSIITETINNPNSELIYESKRSIYRPIKNGTNNIYKLLLSICEGEKR